MGEWDTMKNEKVYLEKKQIKLLLKLKIVVVIKKPLCGEG